MGVTAEAAALAVNEAERAARRDLDAAAGAKAAAREALYTAEAAEREASEQIEARAAELRALLRALAHRNDTEPREDESEGKRYDGRTAAYAVTFGHAYVNVRSSSGRWSSKPQPEVASAYVTRSDLPPSADRSERTPTVYQSARGSSDPVKVAAEIEAAKAAALAALAPLTAAAFLTARGIDPATAPDPSALIDALPMVGKRMDHWQGQYVAYWHIEWHARLRSTGEIVAAPGRFAPLTVKGWDLAEARAEAKGTGRDGVAAEREADPEPRAEAAEAEVQEWAEARSAEALAVIVARL